MREGGVPLVHLGFTLVACLGLGVGWVLLRGVDWYV